MKLVFFDCETTGLALNNKAPYTDIDNWPRLVQLAWIVCNGRTQIVKKNAIIMPVGFDIPLSSMNIHGISTKFAKEQGQRIEEVLKGFLRDINNVDAIIGHNIEFDMKVVQSELYRLNLNNPFENVCVIDTMRLAIDYCKIPGRSNSYRFPKLIELYNKLFSESFEDMHNALADIEATAKCFWALRDRGLISSEEYPCLLSKNEKQRLAEKYLLQAKEIIRFSRAGSTLDCYLKAAELGSIEGMYRLASDLKVTGIKLKVYNDPEYWLEKIVHNSQIEGGYWYRAALCDLIRIYKARGIQSKVRLYEFLLFEDDKRRKQDEARRKNEIIVASEKDESGFCQLVESIIKGTNGFDIDIERANKLIKEGISRGYRSLFRRYSDILYAQHDERYFYYLIEAINDTIRERNARYSLLKYCKSDDLKGYLSYTSNDENNELAKRYIRVAKAYLEGFGTTKDIGKAVTFLNSADALCNFRDYDTIILLCRIYNGEYDESYSNFRRSIDRLSSLLKHAGNRNMACALLGDAYIGRSWTNIILACIWYNRCPNIKKYKSRLRQRYILYKYILWLCVFCFVALITLTIVI